MRTSTLLSVVAIIIISFSKGTFAVQYEDFIGHPFSSEVDIPLPSVDDYARPIETPGLLCFPCFGKTFKFLNVSYRVCMIRNVLS